MKPIKIDWAGLTKWPASVMSLVIGGIVARERKRNQRVNLTVEEKETKRLEKKKIWTSLSAGQRAEIQRKIDIAIALCGSGFTKEHLSRRSKFMKQRAKDPVMAERIASKLRGRVQITHKAARGPNNWAASRGQLRSPSNVVYNFVNLMHFVRSNPTLFLPEDVIWKSRKTEKNSLAWYCRAYRGLSQLFSTGKKVPGSWKGWTAVSDVERRFNYSEDLLNRKTV